MYIDVRLGVACSSNPAQDLLVVKNLIQHYTTFGDGPGGFPLSYERCVLEMEKAGKTIEAARDTDSIMNMFFPPPIHYRTPIFGPLVH